MTGWWRRQDPTTQWIYATIAIGFCCFLGYIIGQFDVSAVTP